MNIQGINTKKVKELTTKPGAKIEFYNGMSIEHTVIDNTEYGLSEWHMLIIKKDNMEIGRINACDIKTPDDLDRNMSRVIENYINLLKWYMLTLSAKTK